MYIIPLTTDPNQTFFCTIPVDGENLPLRFFLRYIEPAGYWIMNIKHGITVETLVDALPILTGEYPAANLLQQYSHLKIGSAVVTPTGLPTGSPEPDDKTLGAAYVLVWGDTDA